MRLLALFGMILFSVTSFAAETKVVVEAPWVRGIESGMENTAAYFTLKNPGGESVNLVRVESSAARVVELHNHVHNKDGMKMERVDQVTIPAAGSVEFKPMGYHVMLIGVKKNFMKSKKVKLKLVFSDGTTKTIEANKKSYEE